MGLVFKSSRAQNIEFAHLGGKVMATAAPSAVGPVHSDIDSTAAIALVVHRATADEPTDRPFVRDVSKIFFELKQRGLTFRDLGLRKIPRGYYSEDVEGFVGQLLSMGYARERSPIRLTEAGKAFCETIVREEKNQAEMTRLRTELEKLMREHSAAP